MSSRAVLAVLLTTSCAVAPPKQRHDTSAHAAREKEWHSSALWHKATASVGAGPKAECEHVRDRIAKESACKQRLCRFGLELAREWGEKCGKLVPAARDAVAEAGEAFAEAVESAASPCAEELDGLLGDACKPGDCLNDAQRWATRCAESEAGPLAVYLLERNVARVMADDERVELDTRSCEAIQKQVREGVSCSDEASCKEAWRHVDTHEDRCSQEGGPRMALGLWQLSIAEGAGRALEPVVTSGYLLHESNIGLVPLVHERGAVLRLCAGPVADLERYLAQRDAEGCGWLVLARTVGDIGELRVGRIGVPTAAPFTSLFPSLAAAGERERESEAELARLRRELDDALGGSAADALPKLLAVLDGHARELARSDAARELVHARDADLAALFIDLADAKVSEGRSLRDVASRVGLAQRARTRPFADVRLDGQVELDAPTRARWLRGDALAPQAMSAYRTALKPLFTAVDRGPKPKRDDLAFAREYAEENATTCALAQRGANDVESMLEECVFRDGGCDQDAQRGFVDMRRSAEDDAEAARRHLDIAASLLGDGAAELLRRADSSGCSLTP